MLGHSCGTPLYRRKDAAGYQPTSSRPWVTGRARSALSRVAQSVHAFIRAFYTSTQNWNSPDEAVGAR
jgi:hypothetical protein